MLHIYQSLHISTQPESWANRASDLGAACTTDRQGGVVGTKVRFPSVSFTLSQSSVGGMVVCYASVCRSFFVDVGVEAAGFRIATPDTHVCSPSSVKVASWPAVPRHSPPVLRTSLRHRRACRWGGCISGFGLPDGLAVAPLRGLAPQLRSTAVLHCLTSQPRPVFSLHFITPPRNTPSVEGSLHRRLATLTDRRPRPVYAPGLAVP